MRFPSSPMTWHRWSSPKTAWPCWRDWGPWGSSVWLFCCWLRTASLHPVPDSQLSMRGAQQTLQTPSETEVKYRSRQQQAQCLRLLVATGDEHSSVEWQQWTHGSKVSHLWPCLSRACTFASAVKVAHWRQEKCPKRGNCSFQGNVQIARKEKKEHKCSKRLHYLDSTEEPRRNLEILNFIQNKTRRKTKRGSLISRLYACCVNFCGFAST